MGIVRRNRTRHLLVASTEHEPMPSRAGTSGLWRSGPDPSILASLVYVLQPCGAKNSLDPMNKRKGHNLHSPNRANPRRTERNRRPMGQKCAFSASLVTIRHDQLAAKRQ